MDTEEKIQIAAKKDDNLRSLELWFRPIFNYEKNTVAGYESQLRINDDKIGVLLPSQYQPVADKSPRCCELSKWAIHEVCKLIAKQISQKNDFGFITVYIPERLLHQKSFPDFVSRCILNSGINGKNLVFAVPLTILLSHFEAASENIEKLNNIGIKILLLDFGGDFTTTAGISNLSSNMVQLDKGLFENFHIDLKAKLVAKAITDLVRNFGLAVIADGIENQSTANEIKDLGCTFVQGDYYGSFSKQIRKHREKKA